MSMATFHLQIVTPDRMVYDGQAERVIVRTLRGDVCILARHIDYAAPLGIGEARVTDVESVAGEVWHTVEGTLREGERVHPVRRLRERLPPAYRNREPA
jgi:F0F1-type ATP synthase epsilon subunit